MWSSHFLLFSVFGNTFSVFFNTFGQERMVDSEYNSLPITLIEFAYKKAFVSRKILFETRLAK